MNRNDLEQRIKKMYAEPIPAPDPAAIESVIRSAESLGVDKPAKRISLAAFIRSQFRFIRPLTWALQLIVLICFVAAAYQLAGIDHAGLILSIAAICTVACSCFDLFGDQEQGMLELEASCRYNYRHILIARMIAFGLVDVVILTFLIIAFGALADVNPLSCILYATVPFFGCSIGCLAILNAAPQGSGSFFSLVFAALLSGVLIGCAYLIPALYLASSLGLWSALFATTFVGLGLQVLRTIRNTSSLIDRHLSHDTIR